METNQFSNGKMKLIIATAVASGALLLSQNNASADSYTLEAGDSFYSVAQLYGMDVYELAALNGLSIYDTIVPGQVLQVSQQVTETAVEATAAEATTTAATSSSDNTYPIGQCTWGVKELATWASNWWGNAGDWAANAASYGYSVGTTPVVGAIICWTDSDSYGHVAYVTAVGDDGKIQVLESNYKDQQRIDNYRGWFDPNNGVTAGTVSYIYPYY